MAVLTIVKTEFVESALLNCDGHMLTVEAGLERLVDTLVSLLQLRNEFLGDGFWHENTSAERDDGRHGAMCCGKRLEELVNFLRTLAELEVEREHMFDVEVCRDARVWDHKQIVLLRLVEHLKGETADGMHLGLAVARVALGPAPDHVCRLGEGIHVVLGSDKTARHDIDIIVALEVGNRVRARDGEAKKADVAVREACSDAFSWNASKDRDGGAADRVACNDGAVLCSQHRLADRRERARNRRVLRDRQRVKIIDAEVFVPVACALGVSHWDLFDV